MNKKQDIKQRKETIVAVRMPKGLLDELKDLRKINHFMDVSDEIRYIIRRYALEIGVEKPTDKKKDQMIADLSRIIAELQNE